MTSISTLNEKFSKLLQWAPIRIVAYLMAIGITIIGATIISRIFVPPAPSPFHALVWVKNILLPVLLLLVYAKCVSFAEKRDASELALNFGFFGILGGVLIGATSIGLFVLSMTIGGHLQLSAGTGLTGIIAAIIIPFTVSIVEELIFRVILFDVFEKVFGSLVALLISSILFGLAHIGNDGADIFSIFTLSFGLGLLLGLAYLLTRNIWLPIGLHAGWNFAEGYLFGLLNSGMRDPNTYFVSEISGPGFITGGSFGPEGSVILLLICLTISLIFFINVIRSGNWQPLSFRMRQVH